MEKRQQFRYIYKQRETVAPVKTEYYYGFFIFELKQMKLKYHTEHKSHLNT